MKCRYPDVFACALLNAQPMGFYAPAQIVRDAREHGVEVREVDVNLSDWDCTLNGDPSPACGRRWPAKQRSDEGRGDASAAASHRPHPTSLREATFSREAGEGPRLHPRHASMRRDISRHHAVRLGFRQIIGASEADMRRSSTRRGAGYDSVRDLWLRTELAPAVLERLAEADAFRSLGLDRREALWAVRGLEPRRRQGRPAAVLGEPRRRASTSPTRDLPPMPLGEHVVEDYRHLSLSLKAHPVAFMRGGSRRAAFCAARRWPAVAAGQARHRRRARAGAPAPGLGQRHRSS